jgi:hypothetical protein
MGPCEHGNEPPGSIKDGEFIILKCAFVLGINTVIVRARNTASFLSEQCGSSVDKTQFSMEKSIRILYFFTNLFFAQF